MGYHRGGFDIVGVDITPQPNYPFPFYQASAHWYLDELLARGPSTRFDVIHASPPCQAYTTLQKQSKRSYPDLVAPTRELLRQTGLPYTSQEPRSTTLSISVAAASGCPYAGTACSRRTGP